MSHGLWTDFWTPLHMCIVATSSVNHMALSKPAPLKFYPDMNTKMCRWDRFQQLPLIDLCVACVEGCSFGMPLGFLEHLRRSNLIDRKPTGCPQPFYVSELWLLTLFPPADTKTVG